MFRAVFQHLLAQFFIQLTQGIIADVQRRMRQVIELRVQIGAEVVAVRIGEVDLRSEQLVAGHALF
ncbi:hypothetical protein AWU82_29795 [Pseudomonas glycinae]|uniref:Secreted protein n=1 Tax=Pseudomonas glycinae TaxID=1785145 RepID=A0ABM6QIC9_9PSED|nr:hypothetical protein AWU82_29795 [Pseudomonas glycinae]